MFPGKTNSGSRRAALLFGSGFWANPPQSPQNCLVTSRALSTIAASFAHTTSGSNAAWPTQVRIHNPTGDDVVSVDEVGVAGDALRDQLRVLDEVRF
jgi:hypothetical protein